MKDRALQLQTVTENPFNAETPFPALKKDRTESDLFYVRNHFDVPRINTSTFKLKVHGAVEYPSEYSIEQLKNFEEKNGFSIKDPRVDCEFY